MESLYGEYSVQWMFITLQVMDPSGAKLGACTLSTVFVHCLNQIMDNC